MRSRSRERLRSPAARRCSRAAPAATQARRAHRKRASPRRRRRRRPGRAPPAIRTAQPRRPTRRAARPRSPNPRHGRARMLKQLAIRNIVLIEHIELEFERGLGVLTGETGAGKSILLDSLGLAFGARADVGLVRSGEDSATVSAEI